MNYLKLNLASFLFLFSLFTYGSNCSSAANNDWTKVATWSCTNPFTSPGCVDSIVINHVVNVNTQIDLTACGPIYIIVNGTLEFKTGSKLKLADGSFFILNNGASIVPGNGGGNSNLIEIGGNDVWTAADGPKSGPLTYISSGPLPIKLLEFNASNNQGRIDLKWITLNEVNNEYFTIEKSKDAQNWIEVVRTLGAGNSLSFTPTFFTLGNALSGVYSASFGLVDLNGGALDSGIFHIDFQVSPVPEPTTVLMLLIGLIGIAASRRGKFLVSFNRSALN